MDVSPSNDNTKSASVPGLVIAPSEDGRIFVFSPAEEAFLVALSDTHDIAAAAKKVGKSIEWTNRFFSKAQTREWISLKSAQHAARSGTTQEWWYSFGRAVLAGQLKWWEGKCAGCQHRMRTYLEPEFAGLCAMPCDLCNSTVVMDPCAQPVKPSREQIEVWKELGARTVPKIERIQHEFVDEEFVFKPKGPRDSE